MPAAVRSGRVALAGFLLLGCAGPLLAQYEEDEQTEGYSERDRAYYERYVEQPPVAETDDDATANLEAFLTRAETLIQDRSYSAGDSEHYRVQTDDPRLRPDTTARLLESFRGFFDEFWSSDLELLPYDETSHVFLFYSFYKFNELLEGDYRYREFRPKGHYGSLFDVITLHTDAGDTGSLADAIVHEAAHQLFTQRILGGELSDSTWLNEGVASYFGYTRTDENGVFTSGEIGGKATALFLRPPKDGGTERKQGLRQVREGLEAARSSERLLVDEVISIRDPATFYGERAPLNYATSWLLVHYLLHGDGAVHAEAFRRYLALERERNGGAAALYRELDLGPTELERGLGVHVKRLKAR